MKFFTRAFWTGRLTDEETAAIRDRYCLHTQALLPALPPALARLIEEISIHDALIRHVIVDRTTDSITLALRGGDLDMGYFDLEILYMDVDWKHLELDVLANRARDRRTEILDHELHRLENGLYQHCLLFWPSDETSIRFKGLQLTLAPREDRRIELGFDPYQTKEDEE